MAKRSKDEMFNVVLTDAVASLCPGLGLRSDKPVSIEALRKLLDKAGMLEDIDDDS